MLHEAGYLSSVGQSCFASPEAPLMLERPAAQQLLTLLSAWATHPFADQATASHPRSNDRPWPGILRRVFQCLAYLGDGAIPLDLFPPLCLSPTRSSSDTASLDSYPAASDGCASEHPDVNPPSALTHGSPDISPQLLRLLTNQLYLLGFLSTDGAP